MSHFQTASRISDAGPGAGEDAGPGPGAGEDVDHGASEDAGEDEAPWMLVLVLVLVRMLFLVLVMIFCANWHQQNWPLFRIIGNWAQLR